MFFASFKVQTPPNCSRRNFGHKLAVKLVCYCEKYINILDDNLWPVIAQHFPTSPYIFQEDNAPCHESRRTNQWKTENDIPTLEWPPQSPDLNIIENAFCNFDPGTTYYIPVLIFHPLYAKHKLSCYSNPNLRLITENNFFPMISHCPRQF
jgi:hypothetical protein